jgi:DNA processing protein
MDKNTSLYYQLALSQVSGVGERTLRALLDYFKTPQAILEAPVKELKQVQGMSELKARACKERRIFDFAEQEMAFINQQGIHTFFMDENDYPQRLKQCADAPILLYYKGSASLDADKVVSIVGTRRVDEYGMRICEELIAGLAPVKGLLVISGLAYGVDAWAHKYSLQHGLPTVGILGHGLDNIYPAVHRRLADSMLPNGGLLTEFPQHTKLHPANFPVRNRIVAGISDATIVVQSDEKGGSMITAALAFGYNREVAAFPGRIHDTRSAGCNLLIKRNQAALITNAADLLALMNWDIVQKPLVRQPQLLLHLSPEEQAVLTLLQEKNRLHADELLLHASLSNTQLAAVLLQLEMQGLVIPLPGKYFSLK